MAMVGGSYNVHVESVGSSSAGPQIIESDVPVAFNPLAHDFTGYLQGVRLQIIVAVDGPLKGQNLRILTNMKNVYLQGHPFNSDKQVLT